MVEMYRITGGQGNQVSAPSRKDSGEGTPFDFTKESRETLEELVEGKSKRSESTRLSRTNKNSSKNSLMKINNINIDDEESKEQKFFAVFDPVSGETFYLRWIADA